MTLSVQGYILYPDTDIFYLMQATNLELFSEEDLNPSINIQKQVINQYQTATTMDKESLQSIEQNKKPEQLFNNLFLDTSDLSKVSKARQILGETANTLTDEELETFLAKLDYLTNNWLDSIEKLLFEGKTLREITK